MKIFFLNLFFLLLLITIIVVQKQSHFTILENTPFRGAVLIALFIILGLYFVWSFLNYIHRKSEIFEPKARLKRLIDTGMNLNDAIEKEFTDFSKKLPKKLNAETILALVKKMSSLKDQMSEDNIIEIYATFIFLICKDPYLFRKSISNVSDEKILICILNMDFENKIDGSFKLVEKHITSAKKLAKV